MAGETKRLVKLYEDVTGLKVGYAKIDSSLAYLREGMSTNNDRMTRLKAVQEDQEINIRALLSTAQTLKKLVWLILSGIMGLGFYIVRGILEV